MPEYGLHIDGGERRDSIWPTILALKLTSSFAVPNVVLHYAERGKPEAYDSGTGVAVLFKSISEIILREYGLNTKASFRALLEGQFATMLRFVASQWENITRYLPGLEVLTEDITAKYFASRAVGEDATPPHEALLHWGKIKTVPKEIIAETRPTSLIKKDIFLEGIENLVGNNCYTLSSNAGSKPQKTADIRDWINQQKRISDYSRINPKAIFSMDIEDFPKTSSGLRHVTTAKNVFYLCDSWSAVFKCLAAAYPRLKELNGVLPGDDPVLLYVSNSLKPGRIFGDPFTGQLTAFAVIFGRGLTTSKQRRVIAYYPHQVHNQLFNDRGDFRENKGIVLMRELVDIAIFHAGVAVQMQSGKII